MMKPWSDLVTTALLGAERAAPTPLGFEGPVGDLLARIPADDRELAVLSAAALLGSYRRAGRLAGAPSAALPSECPPDDMPECRPYTAHLISMTLGKQYASVLLEALALLASARRRLPPALLPDLLDAGRRSRDLRPAIQRVADRRVFWLAAQNPDWAYLALEDDERVWADGAAAARLAYYILVRAGDAPRARALLAETWGEESASERAAFLGAWESSLSHDDEPFLESALDNRSKEVRRAAANLLMRLPNSRYVQRMIARAKPLLSVHKPLLGKARMDVTPPDTCDAAMIRDGVDPKPPQGEGEKAFWMRQIVAAVPLEFWSAALGLGAADLVSLAWRGEWNGPLLIGWRQAARRSQDKDWLIALIRNALENDAAAASTIPELASRLCAADFEALLAPMIAGVPMSDKHPATALAPRHPGPWSLEFSRALMLAIARSAQNEPAGRFAGWSYLQLLPHIGLHAPPAIAGEFQTLWPEDHPAQYQWARLVSDTVQVLSFRNTLITAISEENLPS